MKLTVEQKCAAIVALYEFGNMAEMIHTMLKLFGINEKFIFHALVHYKKMNDIVDELWEERMRSVHLPNVANAVRACVLESPL